MKQFINKQIFEGKNRIFIHFNDCVEKKIESPKQFVIFALNFKNEGGHYYFKTTKKIVVFLKNLRGNQ